MYTSHSDNHKRGSDKRIGTGAMQDFAELHLKPETLAQHGLPDIPHPVPAADLKSALLDNRGLSGKLVTIQRGDALIAGITARDDGRLRVALFRPLDAKSA